MKRRDFSVATGSAVPGWPAEMPLPIDPEWKREYPPALPAGSRRRDAPLADLLCTSPSRWPRIPRASRGRGARSEAFLYRRLQTLPATANRFRLNAELPDPFRYPRSNGSGFALRANPPGHRARRRTASGRRRSLRRDPRRTPPSSNMGISCSDSSPKTSDKHLDDVLDAIQRTLAHQEELPAAR